MSAREQIQQILAARRKYGEQVAEMENQWGTREERKKALEKCWYQIKSQCQRALQSSKPEAAQFRKLLDVLEQLDSSRSGLSNYCEQAKRMIQALKDRFQRSTLNIAVAGIGRCGKSTTLKSIIASTAEDIKDNTIIPTGENSAVTAGKSTVCCIGQNERPHTVIEFHSQSSFLNEVVNTQLHSMMLDEHTCSTLEEFEHLDFDFLRETLNNKKKNYEQRRRAAEAENNTAAETECQSVIDKIDQSYNRLDNELKDKIHANFSDYKIYLRNEQHAEEVDLSETAKYISYPPSVSETDSRPKWPVYCYAVKECWIYTHFPNNDVEALRLIDLPGLGTDSVMEEKCFLTGFDYSVDLALVIRRPDGLQRNIPTTVDTSVFKTLNHAFHEQMPQCTILFQNDGNLKEGDPDILFKDVEKWNKNNYQLELLRGDAKNFEFVQGKLLPDILQFIADHLPKFDNDLLKEKKQPLEDREKNFEETYKTIIQTLKNGLEELPDEDSHFKTFKLAKEVRTNLMEGIKEIQKYYEEGETSNEEQMKFINESACEIEKKTAELEEYAMETYSIENPLTVKNARQSIDEKETAMNYAENELHKIRILLSEKFADLEHLHTNFIKENIHKKVGKILQTAFATADVEVDADLNEFCKQASEIPKCQKLVNAIQNLLDLKVPFYVTVYPEIRHKVFTKLHKTIDSYGNTLSAEDFIQNLQNTMINWADRIRDELTNPRPFLRIICASLERFVDDSIRDEENSIEIFMTFIQRNRKENDLKGIAKAIKEILEEL